MRGVSARQQADQLLTERITTIHTQSRQTSGSPRVHAVLQQAGTRCGRKRVARLMRQAVLAGCRRACRTRITHCDLAQTPAPNVVARIFSVAEADQLWGGDITSVST